MSLAILEKIAAARIAPSTWSAIAKTYSVSVTATGPVP